MTIITIWRMASVCQKFDSDYLYSFPRVETGTGLQPLTEKLNLRADKATHQCIPEPRV